MVNSQNGWPASENRAEIAVAAFKVGSVEFPGGVRTGPVAAVLAYLVAQFHARVEPLVEGWCWGHYFREVTGGGSVSNHGSGTAVDINAPRHGYGDVNTFTVAQRRTIRAILKEVNSSVRWGGDYTGTKDEMHFEINTDQAGVDLAAAKLANKEDDEMSALTDTVVDLGFRVWDWLNGNEKQSGGVNKGKPLPAVVDQNALKWRVEALVAGREFVQDGPTKGEPVAVVQLLNEIKERLAAK